MSANRIKTRVILDRATDRTVDGKRTRTYNVLNAADDSIIGTITETWDSASMSYANNAERAEHRAFVARTANGKNVDPGTSRARTAANVRAAYVAGK